MIDLKRKHLKYNTVECALDAFSPDSIQYASKQLDEFAKFLKDNYGITGTHLVIPAQCNAFLIGNDGKRRLFIKAGRHCGIYKNEYDMDMALYKIDPTHFIKPLYYNDYSKFNFFAAEYETGETLKSWTLRRKQTNEQKAVFVRDIYEIFRALQKSDVVHRDIRPDNFMIIKGHLVLIDFQLAVSKSQYQELDYMRRHPQRLRKLGDPKFQYRPFVWDDAYSLLKVLQFIGRDNSYGAQYDMTKQEIKRAIGHNRIKSAVREGAMHRLVRHLTPRKKSVTMSN